MTMIAGFGAEDWLEEVSASMRVERVFGQLRDGGIILLHDMQKNQKTVDALDDIIAGAKRQGYRFVTLRGLFGERQVTPKRGVIYSEVRNDTKRDC